MTDTDQAAVFAGKLHIMVQSSLIPGSRYHAIACTCGELFYDELDAQSRMPLFQRHLEHETQQVRERFDQMAKAFPA